MKHTLAWALATLLFAGAAHAQTSTPDAATTPAAAGAPAPALTPAQQANQDRIKGERQTCRTQAHGKGIKGAALRTAVIDCMAKVDPPVAKRMKCRQAAKARSLSGDAMKNSVRSCMQSS
jgi:hypothetical protein